MARSLSCECFHEISSRHCPRRVPLGHNMLRDVLTKLPGVATWPCDEINYIWRHGTVPLSVARIYSRHDHSATDAALKRGFDVARAGIGRQAASSTRARCRSSPTWISTVRISLCPAAPSRGTPSSFAPRDRSGHRRARVDCADISGVVGEPRVKAGVAAHRADQQGNGFSPPTPCRAVSAVFCFTSPASRHSV